MTKKTSADPRDSGCNIQTPGKQSLRVYRHMPDLCSQLPEETPVLRPLLVSASEQASILAARAARGAA